MGGKQADVPQWTETGAEQRRDADADAADGLRILLLRREGKGHLELTATICWEEQMVPAILMY